MMLSLPIIVWPKGYPEIRHSFRSPFAAFI
jgi:hypothetical protein